MTRDKSNSFGPERDFLCKGPSACRLWGAPWVAFALGFREPPGLRTVLWATSLAVMGVVCLLNASRCGRVHCRFTGPFFILGAITSLGYGLGLLPLGPSGRRWIGVGTIIGAIGLTYVPENVEGRILFHYNEKGTVDSLIDRRNNEDVVWRKTK